MKIVGLTSSRLVQFDYLLGLNSYVVPWELGNRILSCKLIKSIRHLLLLNFLIFNLVRKILI